MRTRKGTDKMIIGAVLTIAIGLLFLMLYFGAFKPLFLENVDKVGNLPGEVTS